jgi:exopolysaccharide biosynthesis polyprenyl glycosylphosphotransferase
MNKKLQVLKYVIADILSALLAWNMFFFYRKVSIDQSFNLKEKILIDNNFLLGIILIPIFWLVLYLLIGTYSKIYRKSRLKELGQTLLISIIGVILLFFVVLIDKDAKTYKDYYFLFFVLFLLHFGITFAFRLILTSITAYRIHHRIIGFNTIIVGSDKNAITLFHDIESQTKSAGNKFIGFVHVKNTGEYHLGEYMPHLGHYKNILSIIHSNNVEEVIIAIEPSEHKTIDKILTEINGANVVIKVIPDIQDILLGSVKMTAIWDAPLIQISPELMPVWQQSIKRVMDIAISLIVLIGLSPIYLITGILVKMSSSGPIFYSHDRIGLHGKTFRMHKFRSMFVNAEMNGPQLSSKNDPRITPFGKFMRKVRLDEIPQFYNVLKGDMALVGYRPERQFFIEQITKTAPHYRLLFKVKPGITSWGQVKYGYAENVEQMVNRLKYDILYLENMSISVDLKILIYTMLIIVQGRGK